MTQEQKERLDAIHTQLLAVRDALEEFSAELYETDDEVSSHILSTSAGVSEVADELYGIIENE